jgi:drug/metabolite transporter (DMT)-like permease
VWGGKMTRLSREQRQGIAFTVAASFFLGWAPVLGKLAYTGGVAPYTLVTFRTVAAALLLWVVFLFFRRRDLVISWRDLLGCVGVGAVNGFGSLLYYTSLSRLEASLASLLNTLYPFWVVLFLFAAGQQLTRLTLARLAFSMLGVFLLTWGASGELDWLGVTLMIASAATYGWHLVLGQWVLADVPAHTAALYILTTMACVVGIARGLQPHSPETIESNGWLAIAALGVTTALSRLSMFSALARLGGIETSLAGLLELMVSLLLAYVLLGERLLAVQWLGGGLLIVSLMLMVRDEGIRLAKGNEPLEWRSK